MSVHRSPAIGVRHRHGTPRAALRHSASVACAALLAAAPVVALSPAHATPSPTVAAPRTASTTSTTAHGPSSPGAARRIVVLPTGERIALGDYSGHPTATVVSSPDTGLGRSVSVHHVGTHWYALPATAVHYGGVLDPSLFDLGSLPSQAGRLPVSLQLATAGASVPGVTIISRSRTSATGYLTATGAATFGRALAQQWIADDRHGTSTAAPLGLRHMIRAGSTAPVQPNFPQVTLTLKLLGPDGRPADGLIGIANTDDGRKYQSFVFTSGGVAKVSVPKGHYGMLADYTELKDDKYINDYVDIRVDYTVTADGQSVTLDERRATTQPSVRTPRSAGIVTSSFEVDVLDQRDYGGVGDTITSSAGNEFRVTPTPAPTSGHLHFVSGWNLAGTPVAGTPFGYDLSFLDDNGIPTDLRKVVTTGQLATVNARYYSDHSRTAGFGRTAVYPFQGLVFTAISDQTSPLARTEYISAPSQAQWFALYTANADTFGGIVQDGNRVYSPGTTYRADWLRGPLAPGAVEDTGTGAYYCLTCRTSTDLVISLAPFTDTTPGHAGSVDQTEENQTVARFEVYQDGRSVYDEANSAGAELTVPAGEHTYRVVDHIDRRPGGFVLSTQATTDLTFVSSAGNGAALPDRWVCGATGTGRCGVLPIMSATVPLPTSLSDTLPVGATDVDFSVGHLTGARTIDVTSASLSTSLDGVHFTHVAVTDLGHGRYRAHLVTPSAARGKAVSVRVSGTDAAGGSITKTVTDAYVVAGS